MRKINRMPFPIGIVFVKRISPKLNQKRIKLMMTREGKSDAEIETLQQESLRLGAKFGFHIPNSDKSN